jgi:signal transduction histidine kinase
MGRPLTVLMPGRLRPAHRRGLERFCRTGTRTRNWHAAPATGLHRDGHEFPIGISLGEITTDAGRRFTSFIRDVSGRERLEQLRQPQKMESIGQLAGGIAHDFNNILTAIRGYADLLAADLGPDDPRQDSVRGIQDAGERAAELTGKLLTFSRRQNARSDVLDRRTVIEGVRPLPCGCWASTSSCARTFGPRVTCGGIAHSSSWSSSTLR